MAGDIEKLHDHTKTFKAAKAMKRKPYENPFITDSANKQITNAESHV